ADTIADTRAVAPGRRRELLADLRHALTDAARADQLALDLRREIAPDGSAVEAERRLLLRFGECLAGLARQGGADRALTQRVLDAHGLQPADLRGPDRRRARPVLDELRHLALEHVDAAWPYVMAIPPRAPRLRLACIWPLWIGLATLEKIALADDPLDPATRIKVTRRELYRLLAESIAVVSLNPVLSRRHWKRRARAGQPSR